MSLAAKEMEAPPPSIRRAKYALLMQAGFLIAYVVVSVNNKHAVLASATLYAATWISHFIACAFVALATTQMGRRWWRYMSWQAFIPFGGPGVSLLYLQNWRDSRP